MADMNRAGATTAQPFAQIWFAAPLPPRSKSSIMTARLHTQITIIIHSPPPPPLNLPPYATA